MGLDRQNLDKPNPRGKRAPDKREANQQNWIPLPDMKSPPYLNVFPPSVESWIGSEPVLSRTGTVTVASSSLSKLPLMLVPSENFATMASLCLKQGPATYSLVPPSIGPIRGAIRSVVSGGAWTVKAWECTMRDSGNADVDEHSDYDDDAMVIITMRWR